MLRAVSLPGPDSVILPGSYTLDTLPAAADNVDKYARVTDLFGSKRDLVLASQDQYSAYWQPVRPVYKGVMPVPVDVTLVPLKHPSVLTLTGAIPLGITRTLTLGNQFLFPGATFTVKTKLSTLLGALRIVDPISTLLASLAINNSYTYIYDPSSGWEQI